MEAKLASIKSPNLKSGIPASPTARNFSAANRQSLALDNSSNFLSPDSAANPSGQDAAATLAQQRAKLKASNAAHRISAPVLASGGADGRATWGPGSQLGQVAEQNAPAQEVVVNASRPKSTEFSGTLGSPRPGAVGGGEATVPPTNDSWASMVNTPLIPMFQKESRLAPQALDGAANKLNDWTKAPAPGVPRMGDPTIHRRSSKVPGNDGRGENGSQNGAMYDDNGNLIMPGANNGGQHQQQNQQARGVGASGGLRNASGGNAFGGPGGWSGARSPALPNVSSNRFGGTEDGGNHNGMNGLGMQMGVGGFNMGMGSPGMGMGMPGLAGMTPMSPFNMNMLGAMGISPEAQLIAAQLAASGFGPPGWLGMQPQSATLNNRRGLSSARSPGGLKSASSTGSRGLDSATPKGEEDVDPALLNDVPAWLRSLRLHKYTPNFEGMKWQDMVVMDEQTLEGKGVAALGARRKMMKTFEIMRKKMGIEGGPPSLPPSATLASP